MIIKGSVFFTEMLLNCLSFAGIFISADGNYKDVYKWRNDRSGGLTCVQWYYPCFRASASSSKPEKRIRDVVQSRYFYCREYDVSLWARSE